MDNTCQQRRRPARAQRSEAPTVKQETASPATAKLGAFTSGHRVDLPDRIREKMENAFGTDFSDVKLYESETVGEAGTKAVTQGTTFAGSVAKQLGSKQTAALTKTMGTGIGLASWGMNLLKDVSDVRESSKRKSK